MDGEVVEAKGVLAAVAHLAHVVVEVVEAAHEVVVLFRSTRCLAASNNAMNKNSVRKARPYLSNNP